jgi:hypothetical protein
LFQKLGFQVTAYDSIGTRDGHHVVDQCPVKRYRADEKQHATTAGKEREEPRMARREGVSHWILGARIFESQQGSCAKDRHHEAEKSQSNPAFDSNAGT